MSNKITITGDLGSGKSTVAKKLCEMLGYKYMSTGQIHRSIASNMNMDALELNLHAEQDAEIDRQIDAVLINLNQDNLNYIVDSRLAWHFVNQSLKVYLRVAPQIGAERIRKDDTRSNEPLYQNQQDAVEQVKSRKQSENRRFLEKYGIDCGDDHNYDVIIDTSISSIEDTVQLLYRVIMNWVTHKTVHRLWLSPKLLIPIEPANENNVGSAEANAPVGIAADDGYYFIASGHRQVSDAINDNIPFLPVIVVQFTNECIPRSAHIKEWETKHHFTFYHLPTKISNHGAPQLDQ
jgi:CMP/dCMP kinase